MNSGFTLSKVGQPKGGRVPRLRFVKEIEVRSGSRVIDPGDQKCSDCSEGGLAVAVADHA